ncbi:unnamed protein product [Phytophthora lilii]|uniref:Unnamed protein product n=1 Tax=Phytophthora lilii TaxID=2077276 RepID=A0A9W6U174_9STRA|nr:unnamed protein product [Phytophthora lilii]
MRFAYVAQHAFHHIESHLDETANQYIQWRFQSGEDKELLAKETRKLTKEEKEHHKNPVNWEGEKRVLEEIVSRRKFKKSFEYELKWEKCRLRSRWVRFAEYVLLLFAVSHHWVLSSYERPNFVNCCTLENHHIAVAPDCQ